MRKNPGAKRPPGNGEEGVGLVESLIAVAILGLTLVVLLSGLSTGSIAVSNTDERVVAENMARSLLEYTKSAAYVAAPASYPTLTPSPGYSATVQTAAIPNADSNIEKITVSVMHGSKTLLTVEDYKVNR